MIKAGQGTNERALCLSAPDEDQKGVLAPAEPNPPRSPQFEDIATLAAPANSVDLACEPRPRARAKRAIATSVTEPNDHGACSRKARICWGIGAWPVPCQTEEVVVGMATFE